MNFSKNQYQGWGCMMVELNEEYKNDLSQSTEFCHQSFYFSEN